MQLNNVVSSCQVLLSGCNEQNLVTWTFQNENISSLCLKVWLMNANNGFAFWCTDLLGFKLHSLLPDRDFKGRSMVLLKDYDSWVMDSNTSGFLLQTVEMKWIMIDCHSSLIYISRWEMCFPFNHKNWLAGAFILYFFKIHQSDGYWLLP